LTRKHIEYFPFEIKIDSMEIRALQLQLSWYRVGEFFFGVTFLNQIHWLTNRSFDAGKIYSDFIVLEYRSNEGDCLWAKQRQYPLLLNPL
jgi:hypothetical protein